MTSTSNTTKTNSSSNDSKPVPSIAEPPTATAPRTTNPDSNATSNAPSTVASNVTSDTEDTYAERMIGRSTLCMRPGLGGRKESGSMIVPHDHPDIEIQNETFPPGDARAMSPKRSSEETDRIIGRSRLAVQNHCAELQSSLSALVEKVEKVEKGHEKLEKDNASLQEYIGGLTRSMSRTDLTGKGKK
ncbi:hypothetical protein MMC28_004182 [Mycoblastus sanguinarius]|nr:hypothetical protein [Mycoblastus sanguinarius]